MTTEFDCQSCGACCTGWQAVGIHGDDELVRIRRRERRDRASYVATDGLVRVRAGAHSYASMRMVKSRRTKHGGSSATRCAALVGTIGRQVGCAIYDVRPDLCRRFAAGAPECIAARKNAGLSVPSEPDAP